MLKPGRILLLLLVPFFAACAALAGLDPVVLAPRFEMAGDRQSELRLLAPSFERPLGGLAVRIWARVENPNGFSINLSSVDGTLFLEGRQAALVDFPLGLPLPARQDTVIPLDVGISLADLPGLTDVASRALSGAPIAYNLDGTLRVNAGMLGQPLFGPMTLLEGQLQTQR